MTSIHFNTVTGRHTKCNLNNFTNNNLHIHDECIIQENDYNGITIYYFTFIIKYTICTIK